MMTPTYSLVRIRHCALLLALTARLPSLASTQDPDVARLRDVVRRSPAVRHELVEEGRK